MHNKNLVLAQTIINAIATTNIKHFFIAPGMRNTPLIKAITLRDDLSFTTGIDERSLAYNALGRSLISKIPSVLICTSGTALSNFFPALIEANKSKISLIILSADRPYHAIWSHQNQTINQQNFFSEYAQSINLEIVSNDTPLQIISNQIFLKLNQSIDAKTSLHINIPFNEPLISYPIEKFFLTNSIYPNLKLTQKTTSLSNISIEIKQLIENKTRPLIIFGAMSIRESQQAKELLTLNIPMYFDITSNLKFYKTNNTINSFDLSQSRNNFEEYNPNLIIHIGGKILSKYYQIMLQKRITPIIEMSDFCFNKSISTSSSIFCLPFDINYINNILLTLLKNKTILLQEKLTASKSNSEPTVQCKSKLNFNFIAENAIKIMNNSYLYIGNSSIIRAFDKAQEINQNIKVLYNRGVSGIEGLISSAVGTATFLFPTPIYLFVGDISFIHDLNSLVLLQENMQANLKGNHQFNLQIFILNNKSGGIFSNLDIKQDSKVLEIISTRHNLNFQNIIKAFDIPYLKINTTQQYTKALQESLQIKNSKIYEVELLT